MFGVKRLRKSPFGSRLEIKLNILVKPEPKHFIAYILPVSTLRHPNTSPNPPRPMILCTEKSPIVKSLTKWAFFAVGDLTYLYVRKKNLDDLYSDLRLPDYLMLRLRCVKSFRIQMNLLYKPITY